MPVPEAPELFFWHQYIDIAAVLIGELGTAA
jgi:hypothetical protein